MYLEEEITRARDITSSLKKVELEDFLTPKEIAAITKTALTRYNSSKALSLN